MSSHRVRVGPPAPARPNIITEEMNRLNVVNRFNLLIHASGTRSRPNVRKNLEDETLYTGSIVLLEDIRTCDKHADKILKDLFGAIRNVARREARESDRGTVMTIIGEMRYVEELKVQLKAMDMDLNDMLRTKFRG
ncbi:hypothetical protein RUND412_004234 [Rhizina undulata]